ncbi:hypothetical protein [Hydrogenophaga soli]
MRSAGIAGDCGFDFFGWDFMNKKPDNLFLEGSLNEVPLFSKGEKLMAWAAAISWLFSAVWGTVQDVRVHPNPIPGYRVISADLWVAWPVSILCLYVLWVVAFQRRHNALGLACLSGYVGSAWLGVAMFVSPSPAIVFAFMSGYIFQAAKKLKQNTPFSA